MLTYRCRADHASGRCTTPASVTRSLIEKHVVAQFFEALGPDGILVQASTATDTVDLEHAVAAAQAELAAWVTSVSVASIGKTSFIAGLEARQAAADVAQAALSDAAHSDTGLPPAHELREMWPTLTTGEQRRILSAGIDAVILRRGNDLADRTVILFAGQMPSDFPRRGRRVPLQPFRFDDTPPNARLTAA